MPRADPKERTMNPNKSASTNNQTRTHMCVYTYIYYTYDMCIRCICICMFSFLTGFFNRKPVDSHNNTGAFRNLNRQEYLIPWQPWVWIVLFLLHIAAEIVPQQMKSYVRPTLLISQRGPDARKLRKNCAKPATLSSNANPMWSPDKARIAAYARVYVDVDCASRLHVLHEVYTAMSHDLT